MKPYLIILISLLFACKDEDLKTTNSAEVDHIEVVENDYSYKVFKNQANNWGYDIYNNDVKFIHQPHIPCLAGNQGFISSKQAVTTARYIIYKLDNNILPPSISKNELDSLGIL